MKFVTSEASTYEEAAADETSQVEDGHGRGSMVWFNQASLFQSAETGFMTLTDAKAAGHSGTTDFKADAEKCFQKFSFTYPLDSAHAPEPAPSLLRPFLFHTP